MTANAVRTRPDATALAVSEEDLLRARFYELMAHLLATPPDANMLADLVRLEGDDSELGLPLGELAVAAAHAVPQDVSSEFHDLFIGLGRGELLPYASYYLAGFLNEKPLARLRARMRALGIERDPTVSEREDHMAAILDMMAGLIVGRFGPPADLVAQKDFFEAHLGDWGPYFFRDLEKAETARLYRPFGRLGRVFLGVEVAVFAMIEQHESGR
ncbi:molecular chaperone TorD family protein [Breoghania sp.]|uniref:TorD/DmsD family molecular chaperone n=1 Tax=Breoghania sp. TaxID=2065378 RepID=UPI00261428B3|nr:molecular chaperone TorD family protein [Breoghania sp.]MDJ0931406.1 molecular chaperone TorD family protein [Breoghania sp.]